MEITALTRMRTVILGITSRETRVVIKGANSREMLNAGMYGLKTERLSNRQAKSKRDVRYPSMHPPIHTYHPLSYVPIDATVYIRTYRRTYLPTYHLLFCVAIHLTPSYLLTYPVVSTLPPTYLPKQPKTTCLSSYPPIRPPTSCVLIDPLSHPRT